MRILWTLPLLLVACGEPIEKRTPGDKKVARPLPVVASPRQEKVGQAYRVTLSLTRWPAEVDETTEPASEIISFVNVVQKVENGIATQVMRYSDDGSQRVISRGDPAGGFEGFETLLPRREEEVPDTWTVNGALAGLRHTKTLSGFPKEGGEARCRLDRVVVSGGRARAIMALELDARAADGVVKLTGKFDYDLKLKLIVRVELRGTIGDESLTILATRNPTKVVPGK